MLILECSEAAEMCANLKPFLNIIKIFLQVLRWTVPILLIALGSFDMFKAVTKADDEKAINEARNNLIRRIIYGVIVFLIPFLINVILELVGSAIATEDSVNATTWIGCWNETVDMSSCTDIYEKTEKNTTESGTSSSQSTNQTTIDTPKTCEYVCNDGGSLTNNKCYKKVLDANSFDGTGTADCKSTCGSKAINYSIAKNTGDGFTYCDCYYPVSNECN